MLSARACLRKVEAVLAGWTAEPGRVPGAAPTGPSGYAITDHRVTPGHVLVAYGAAPSPSGDRDVLLGTVPFAVDRQTGEVTEWPIPLLMRHWPEACSAWQASLWLTGKPGHSTTIRPAGPLSGVCTIEAIRALRLGLPLSLREAKRTVEAMVENGVADVEVGGLHRHLVDPAARAMARETCASLERAGVALEVDGVGLLALLDLIDPPAGKRDPVPGDPIAVLGPVW